MSPLARRSRRRLVWSGDRGRRRRGLRAHHPRPARVGHGEPRRGQRGRGRPPSGCRTQDPPGTPPHNHNDPATKNADLPGRRGRPATPRTRPPPPSAPPPRRTSRASARRPDPQLTTARRCRRGPDVPQDRYAMANGCYRARPASRSSSSRPTSASTCSTTSSAAVRASPTAAALAAPERRRPSGPARKVGNRFTFTNAGTHAADRSGTRPVPRSTGTNGCAAYPEADDRHHGRAARRRHAVPGGARVRRRAHPRHGLRVPRRRVHCGKPWHEYGAPYALVDCPDHTRHRRLRRGPRGVPVRRARATTRSAGRRSRTGRRRTR